MNKDQYTRRHFMLPVGDGHKLNVIEWGAQSAKVPVIFLHGGPGSSVKDKYKQAFDPQLHRVIFFDQRGAGSSTPKGSLKNNTTHDLIEDINKIAKEFKLKSFYLHGSSWGSALALAYSIAYPKKVRGLVIGGVYTATRAENDWIDNGGFRAFYPDVWQQYLEMTPKAYRDDPSTYHIQKLLKGTAEERKVSGYAYEFLEGAVIALDDRRTPTNLETYDPAKIRLQAHYLSQDAFLPDNHILQNASKLKMPVHIVQGRYDMVCPPKTAYALHQALPNSRLYWTTAGHVSEHETYNTFKAILASLE